MSQSPTKRGVSTSYLRGWEQISQLIESGQSFSGRERHCCFVNTGGSRFAQASSATGLDYLDDGRAAAIVDWDHDGDLDIWLTNRTGPRVRYLQNETDDAANFVAFRLQGQNCNRDAIGTRLEIELPDDDRKHIKTLHAGNGFLSQSSKWVHFGLGSAERVKSLTIRWPDGSTQKFEDLEANQRYLVTQGTEALQPWTSPRGAIKLGSSVMPNLAAGSEARVVMAIRPKMPAVKVNDMNGQPTTIRELAPSGPVLVNLWQYTCVPCLKELQEFSKEVDRIGELGLDIVAVHLSNPGTDPQKERETAQQTLDRIEYPFALAMGSDDSIERLEKLQKSVLQKHRGTVFPTSFLVDADDRIVAVYKGPIVVDELLNDMKLININGDELLRHCLPFAGRWHEPLVE